MILLRIILFSRISVLRLIVKHLSTARYYEVVFLQSFTLNDSWFESDGFPQSRAIKKTALGYDKFDLADVADVLQWISVE